MYFPHASLTEVDVPDCQSFIHDQDLRLYMDRDRECQSDGHAARVGLDGLINEIADLGELLDLPKFKIHVTARKTENGSIEVDVVLSAEFRIEAGSKLEQRGNSTFDRYCAVRGLQDASHHLEQGALSGPVFPYDAERLGRSYLKGDIAEGPE